MRSADTMQHIDQLRIEKLHYLYGWQFSIYNLNPQSKVTCKVI